jgi:hypothetical protein
MSIVPFDASRLAPPDTESAGRVSRTDESGALSRSDLELPRYAAGHRVAGKYRLIRILGRGGMGDVWLAHNETLDIEVAIKLMRHESRSPEATERLLREARAAARLRHPAIVRIFDFGAADHGEPYIVMERLVGEDLATLLGRRGRLPSVDAVKTILPIVEALASAHAKGVVHRDIKPENVFLARRESERLQPMIVDFGVAKVDVPMDLELTKNGMLLGSPAYMSPEQARGAPVDHRADIWSLAVVLYEMVTGVRPFDGRTRNAILVSIGRDEPRPLTQLSAGDDELWAIVAKGLRKNPDARWPAMRSFGQALANWLIARGTTEDLAGAVLDATWAKPAAGRLPDELGVVSQIPHAAPREAVNTLPRAVPAPALVLRRWLVTGGVSAAVVGAAAVMAMTGHHATPPPVASATIVSPPAPPRAPVATTPPAAPAPAARAAPAATPSRAKRAKTKPIPVKSLAQIPVDRSPSAAGKKPAPRRAAASRTSPSKPR